MGYNKIPLALGFNDSTGNASGLVEFTLNLSDVGDACSSAPEEGQALVYNADGEWCPSTLPAPGSFNGNLSDVGQVCSATPSNGQSLVWSGGSDGSWCPSTVSTGGGGGGITSVSDADDVNFDAPGDGELIVYDTNKWVNKTVVEAGLATTAAIANVAYTNQSNTFTQPNTFQNTVKLANVAQNSLMITDATSAVSSVSGASGSLTYFSGTTPRPVLTGIRTVLDEASVTLSDLTDVCDAAPSAGQALVWSSTGVWCASTIPTGGGGGGDPLPTATNAGDILLADAPGVVYSASAPSDAGIMQLDPYFTADDDGAVAQWDGTKLEVKFPDSLFIRVIAAENISKGDAVYATTTTESGNRIYVGLANAGDSTRMPAIGIAESDINAGGNGKIITFGRADGVNTTLDGTAAVGDTLYVGTTNGELAANKPDQPTELIQNVGIVTDAGTNGRIKVTGVGRANDIPVNVDVVGSATIGTNNVFTQTDAQLDGTTADHLVITNASNKISSVASSTLFDQGIVDKNIATTPIPRGDLQDTYVIIVNGKTGTSITLNADDIGDATTNNKFATQTQLNKVNHLSVTAAVDLNNIEPGDLNGTTVGSNKIVAVDSAGSGFVQGEIHNLADVSQGETDGWPNGCILQYDDEANSGSGAFVSATIPGIDATDSGSVSIKIDHGAGLSGLGDDDHTQYVLADGTRAITGDLSTVGVSATSGSVATTPTAANHIANKSYVDSQVPTPSYFLAFASANQSIADEQTSAIGWSSTTEAYISDPAGNITLNAGDAPDPKLIDINADGVYQIDCSIHGYNNINRLGLEVDLYVDRGSGLEVSGMHQSGQYVARGATGELIFRGTAHLNTLLSLNSGDKLAFYVKAYIGSGGICTILQNGTYVRIVKVA